MEHTPQSQNPEQDMQQLAGADILLDQQLHCQTYTLSMHFLAAELVSDIKAAVKSQLLVKAEMKMLQWQPVKAVESHQYKVRQ